MTTTQEAEAAPRRRNPAPYILVGVAVLLGCYYLVVIVSGVLQTTTTVPVTGDQGTGSPDYLGLQLRISDVDLANRVIQASVLPSPNGDLVGTRPGEMSKSLRIEVVSAQQTTSVVTFPGKSIIDPTAVSLTLDRGDTAYPFDRPFADFTISVTDDQTGKAIPFMLTIDNAARPWLMTAEVGTAATQGDRVVVPVTLAGVRDPLSITLVMFYVLAILLTTLMAVVTIGVALLRRDLEFSNIIWLSATMLSFPVLRAAMPGAPPIGTALDYLVLFPCICLIAALLVWTGAHLLWRESTILRSRTLHEEPASE